MPSLRIKRGTRAQIAAAATAGQLAEGELYLITDEGRLAVGLSATAYQALAIPSDPGGATLWPKRSETPRIVGDVAGTALTTLVLTASRQYFVPFSVPRPVALTGLRISVTAASTGTASVGIYGNAVVGGNDAPGALLASATGINTGLTGVKDGLLILTLMPGTLYWASLIASGAATVYAVTVASAQTILGRTPGSTTAVSYLYAGGSSSTMPPTAPTTLTNGTGITPAIHLVE